MLLEYGLGLREEAAAVEEAIRWTIGHGCRTADLEGQRKAATTSEVAAAIRERVGAPRAAATRP
jgi:isocitrate/isopropylmalate dehydrogenase